MKKALLFVIIFPLLAAGQCEWYTEGKLKAEINGDSVVLKTDSAHRNCGAWYDMQVYLEGDTLIWFQYDKGFVASCDCFFNLSVTLDSLAFGQHVVKVFFSTWNELTSPWEYDTCYLGLILFEVNTPNPFTFLNITGQSQSDCIWLSDFESKESTHDISIYPNPASDIIYVETSVPGEKIISVYDLNSRLVLESESTGNFFQFDIHHLVKSLYFISIKSKDQVFNSKFYKL